jgi:Chalcone isomerase-like
VTKNRTTFNEDRRQWLLRGGAVLGGASCGLGGACLGFPGLVSAAELEGIKLEDSMVVNGKKMVLNGYGLRKRGYFKGDVTALYMPERRNTVEGVLKLDGFRRIQRNILRTFSSSTISRLFISDFKEVATDQEFRALLPVISQIGAAYAQVKSVGRGDVINVDWTPGLGWTADHNGKKLTMDSGSNEVLVVNNSLAYQVYLRMFIGPTAPESYRNGLLGLS